MTSSVCVRPPCPAGLRSCPVRCGGAAFTGPSTSSFIPRHIEHPALRHSNPASVKTRPAPPLRRSLGPDAILARPSLALRSPLSARAPRTWAASRRSSIRALVRSRETPIYLETLERSPGPKIMYSSARLHDCRSASSWRHPDPEPAGNVGGHAGARAPGDLGLHGTRVKHDMPVEVRIRVASQLTP